MKFIHTADWHLGRVMYGAHLINDQAYVLEEFVQLARNIQPDVIIISGDIYDRAVPPAEAVELLDDVLSRIILDLGITIILIAGNHDSPSRLQFGSRLLAGQKLHVFGSTRYATLMPLSDEHGQVDFYVIPYTEPSAAREKFQCETIRDHQTAIAAIIESLGFPQGSRSVIVAHAFVSGCLPAESERPLSVGGADMVDAAFFMNFSYAALGHLHRPQTAGADHIRYPGSLLKYSFSEVDHSKGVTFVEMDANGFCHVEQFNLSPRRDVRKIGGFLNDLIRNPNRDKNLEDYLMVTLLDSGAILDAMGKLRQVYPNVLHIERPCLSPDISTRRPADHRKLNDIDLFAAFFSQVTGVDLTEAERAGYEAVIEELRRREREASNP